MIEVDEPEKIVDEVADKFKLPFAWKLIECNDYLSAGINFGDLNIEFIKFNKRFGIADKKFHGFSGISFEIEGTEECRQYLVKKGHTCRVGESTNAHTTITIDENEIFPTLFVVKYNFDTNGWRKRLASDFTMSNGGIYNIKKFKSLEINQPDSKGILSEMGLLPSDRNRITFTGDSHGNPVFYNEIPNLELVII